MLTEICKPTLKHPFPLRNRYWTDPKTGLVLPKGLDENISFKTNLLAEAAHDTILQADLLAACKESLLYFVNAFVWTYHQFDINPITGERIESPSPHVPFITWEIQDELFNEFETRLAQAPHDVLISKCRDMGASWCCVRSEEHTSELQSHSFISYAVFCLKKKNVTGDQSAWPLTIS